MKILIVGLGTIGTLYGWAFSQAGLDVIHLLKDGRIEKYRHGIQLDIYDLRPKGLQQHLTTYKPQCITEAQLNDEFHLVIIPTKSYQLISTIKQLKDKLTHAVFLIFCAFWGELSVIDALLPRERYLFGYAGSTGGYGNNAMMLNIKEKYRIGPYAQQICKSLQPVIDIFSQANFKADLKQDMLAWLWTHHAIVAGLMGTSLYAGLDNVFENPIFINKLIPAVREALSVVQKRGVNLEHDAEAKLFLQQDAKKAFTDFYESYFRDKAGQRALQHGHHQYAKEEMKQFYLDVVNTGEILGVAMPILTSFKDKLCN